ncbi:MAG: hypothetical protein DI529_14065 [Chryseobacterium sp.]|nr:MAG: hypothetical protein DI529_14065 [Chryseobacterium sp.]
MIMLIALFGSGLFSGGIHICVLYLNYAQMLNVHIATSLNNFTLPELNTLLSKLNAIILIHG